ncbi:hypothetical protein [Streptomyces sp. 7-21]|uniref:hypothetical protein n=1 Tax=Streptomyces sp. 7-21 TaxID=2802283 RepID=UPI00191CBB1A|nr:hypothetical protein [Streptomyces sp. 7-21]MBL1066640.1 hypothetical protein [Streptomyces sp. 7-21]
MSARAGGRPRVRTAAAAAAAALALLLAGCGSSGGAEAGGPAAAPPGEEQTPAGPQAPAGEEDGMTGRTVPREELTPAEGSFTEEERDYLTGRVPEGTDPAAVLQLGTEACDRVGYLARHDRPAAVAALRDGEIPGAEDAIRHLCPEHTGLLEEALGEGGAE